MKDTWSSPAYSVLPKLKKVSIPTLVLYSDRDFIPAGSAEHITQALPNARMLILKDCGHCSYMECPAAVHKEIDAFLQK